MKQEITNRITHVLLALGNITVSGKNNLLNLGGSIGILEEVLQIIEEPKDEPEK